MDSRLVKFLSKCEVNKGDPFTHTSKIKPCRRYYIEGDNLDEFYNIYNTVIADGGMAGITEKPPTVVPLIVDIDFRYSIDSLKRHYTPTHVKNIISIYHEIIEEIVEEPDEKMFYTCVLEKTGPTVQQNRCKDGFHLHFPYFYTEHWVQKEYIRNEAIKRVTERKILDDIPMVETIDKVFDKNIPSVTWLMYGSRKDIHSEAYTLTSRYDKNLDIVPLKTIFKKDANGTLSWNLPKHLSIRKNEDPTPLKEDISVKKPIVYKKRKREYQRDLDAIFTDLTEVEFLLQMLDEERADDYSQWIELGWILYNISEGHSKGLQKWIEFSKKSDKFQDGICEKEWDKMEIRGYTLGTLKHFAKNDSPSEFIKWRDSKIDYTLDQGISMAHNDIAKILHMIFENQFVCADVEKDIWYEFKNHRWNKNIKGITLRSHLSHTLTSKYFNLSKRYYEKIQGEVDIEQKHVYSGKIATIGKLIDKLKNSTFKNCVMKEAMEYFYDKEFSSKMDENPHLLVCENGVYDTEKKEFRDGRPEDYCTKSTKLYYHEFSEDDPRIIELNEIFKKIFVNPQLYKFFRQTASDLIRGGNRHKIFVIWSGMGDNGKSVCADLLELAFGDYYYTPPTTILTGKQQQSAGATSELLPCKGARIVVVSETDNADVLNCGTMKKLTGGDPFYARGIFKEPIKITPQFKLILHCNKMPNIAAEDKASWNRIRVLPYESTFVKSHMAPSSLQEQYSSKKFPMDKSLKDRLNDLAEAFLWWLIRDYEKYGDNDLYEPSEVTSATSIYHKTNDFYMQFIDESIKETNDNKDHITLAAIYQLFKEWFKDSYPGRKIPNRTMVKEAMEKKLGKDIKGVWRGYIIYDPDEDHEDISES